MHLADTCKQTSANFCGRAYAADIFQLCMSVSVVRMLEGMRGVWLLRQHRMCSALRLDTRQQQAAGSVQVAYRGLPQHVSHTMVVSVS